MKKMENLSLQQIGPNELQTLLDAYRQFAPLYGDGFSNHLPMALVALSKVGADQGQLQRFAADYCRHLSPREASDASAAASLLPQLGAGQFERDARFFADQLDAIGVQAVLKTWVPRLLPGLSTAAFHSLIRTAYAVECDSKLELTDALAFWSSEYVEFALPWVERDCHPSKILDEVIAAFRASHDCNGNIIEQMVAAAQNSFFAPGMPLPGRLSLDGLRTLTLDLYREHEDFTLLHTVTATHALRKLLPFSEDEAQACRFLWQGVLLAVATVAGTLAGNHSTATTLAVPAGWEQILLRCRDSLDDHVVKLVYTAWDESRLGDEPGYRAVAARKVGLSGGLGLPSDF